MRRNLIAVLACLQPTSCLGEDLHAVPSKEDDKAGSLSLQLPASTIHGASLYCTVSHGIGYGGMYTMYSMDLSGDTDRFSTCKGSSVTIILDHV
jgi:hypothetical protein